MHINPETSIVLIPEPLHVIDFKIFAPKEDVALKVEKAAESSFAYLQAWQYGIQQAYSVSWILFKNRVLGYEGPGLSLFLPVDLGHFVLRVFHWMGALAEHARKLAFAKFKHQDTPCVLQKYDRQINMSHLRTKQRTIDASAVPAEVKIDDLITIFDEAAYRESSLTMDGHTYTKEELREKLVHLVDTVKNRVPSVVTPQPHEPNFEIYFQQTENALRLCIDKVNSDLKKCEKKEGIEYENLLETKRCLPRDLAFAAAFCGTRHLSVAMAVYHRLFLNDHDHFESLDETLIELLASKRKVLAEGLMEKYHYVKDQGVDAHTWTEFMMKFGEPLGIPESGNIVETYQNSLNANLCYTRFFEFYTVDLIINTVQEKVKESALFRSKIIDWLRDTQSGVWKKEEYAKRAPQLINDINAIIDDREIDITAQQTNLHTMQKMMKSLKADAPLPGRPEYLLALFKYLDMTLNPGSKKKSYNDAKALSALEEFLKKGTEGDFFLEAFTLLDKECERKEADDSLPYSPFFEDAPLVSGLSPLIAYLKMKKPAKERIEQFWVEVFTLSSKWCLSEFAALEVETRRKKIEELKKSVTGSKYYDRIAKGEDLSEEIEEDEELSFDESMNLSIALDLMRDLKKMPEEWDLEWCHKRFEREGKLAVKNQIQALKNICSPELYESLIEDREIDFKHHFINQEKAKRIKRLLPLSDATIQRMIEGKSAIEAVVADQLELQRHEEFVEKLKLESMASTGLSPEIMELLLVAKGVLNPQNLEARQYEKSGEKTDSQVYLEKVYHSLPPKIQNQITLAASFLPISYKANPLEGLVDSLANPLPKEPCRFSEEDLNALLALVGNTGSKNRYKFQSAHLREKIYDTIFDLGYRTNPELMIEAARQTKTMNMSAYPTWKKVALIDIPHGIISEVVVAIFNYSILALPLIAYKVAYLIITNAPFLLYKCFNLALSAASLAFQYKFEVILLTFIAKGYFQSEEESFFRNPFRALNPTVLLNNLVLDIPLLIHEIASLWIELSVQRKKITQYFAETVKRNVEERAEALRPEVYRIWKAQVSAKAF